MNEREDTTLLEQGTGKRELWSWRVLALALFAAAAVILFFRLDARPVTRHSEERCLVAARAMVESGDYLVPRMGERVRLQKPPLYYWLVAAAAPLAGGVNRLAVRLPSAVAALLLLLLVFRWGKSLGGPKLGLAAAALLATTAFLYTQGRRGDAEMVLALCVTSALFLFDRMFWGCRRSLTLLGVLVAVGFLVKATTAMVLIGLPIFLTLVQHGSLRRALKPRAMVFILLALLAGASWYWVIFLRVPGAWELVYAELVLPLGVDSASPSTEHYRPPWTYLWMMWQVAFPTLLALPLLVWRGVKTRFWRDEPRLRFLAVSFVSLFALFSIIPQKQKHYLLPLLPLLVLLLGEGFVTMREAPLPIRRGWLRAISIVGAAVALFATLLIPAYYGYLWELNPAWWVPPTLILAVAGLPLLWRPGRHRLLRIAAGYLLSVLAAFSIYYGSFSIWHSRGRLGLLAEADSGDGTHLQAKLSQHPFLERIFGEKSD